MKLAFLRRPRHVFCGFFCCLFLYTFVILLISDVSEFKEEVIDEEPKNGEGLSWIRNVEINSSNGEENKGLLVQLWPKNTLELIRNAYKKESEKRAIALRKEEVETQKLPRNIEKPQQISKQLVPCGSENVECKRFRHFIVDKWPHGKPRAAFYFLTQPERLQHMQRALQSVDAYFNNQFHYPIIVFHEADLIPYIQTIRNFTSSEVFFQEIEFSTPDFIQTPLREDIPCLSTIGYRHMCRFHAKGVFQQPIMRGLEYYWRLDDDSALLRKVNYDVFQFMQQRNLLYGYSWRHLDSFQCTTGLWKASWEFVNRTGIKPEFLDEWEDPKLYYNNFEISKMDLWLSQGYARYVEYLDRLGGMYYHRWGDAPIKGIAVAIFVPKEKIHRFKDIGYQHGSYINR